jgi:parvulin-like peptidyl-prolyl isomerase
MTKKNLIWIFCALIAGMGVTRAIQAATELARVNGETISLEDFNRMYHENLKFFQQQSPTKKNVLDDIIKRELAIQEAKKEGLDRDPEVMERMNNVLYQALVEKKLTKSVEEIHVTDSEAKSFYEKNPEIRTSHIFIAVPIDAPAAAQKKAYDEIKKIYDEHILGGKEGFAEVAQKYSQGPTALMGGDVGYQNRDHLDPDYYKAALSLSTGKVSGIVRSQFGYHIIKVTARHSWEDADHAVVKQLLIEHRRDELFDKYMNQLRKQANVTVHSELLKD